MNQLVLKSFGSVESVRKYAGALRSSTRHINAGGEDRDILKIDDRGDWLFGQDKTPVERDDLWAINPLTIRHGYIAFEGKEVCFDMDGDRAEMVMSVTQELPEYDQLPELDVRPRKGDKPVRWQFQMALELVCVEGPNKGAEVTFKPCSMGGLRCIRMIAEEIARRFDDADNGDIVPVVELDSRSYENKNYGKTIFNPLMHIVEWIALDEDVLAGAVEVKEEPRTARKVETDRRGEPVDQRSRTKAPADDVAAEEPRRGRGRPRKEEVREEPVEEATVAQRGRRSARDRDEVRTPETDAPANGRGRRDAEDSRSSRADDRGRESGRDDRANEDRRDGERRGRRGSRQ